jgi:hypothetical protein
MKSKGILSPAAFAGLLATLASACVPTVNQPLVVGREATAASLKQIVGNWQVKTDGGPAHVQILLEPYRDKQALRFVIPEKGKEAQTYHAQVQQIRNATFVLNFSSKDIQLYDGNEISVRPGEPRFVIALARISGKRLVITMMNEAKVRADIKSGDYGATAWNMCQNQALSPQTAVAPGKVLGPVPMCVQLTPSRTQFLDYITRRASEIFSADSAIVMTRM